MSNSSRRADKGSTSSGHGTLGMSGQPSADPHGLEGDHEGVNAWAATRNPKHSSTLPSSLKTLCLSPCRTTEKTKPACYCRDQRINLDQSFPVNYRYGCCK